MSNDYCTKHSLAFDWDDHPEGCPECVTEGDTVKLINHDQHNGFGTGQARDRDHWGVAVWRGASGPHKAGYWLAYSSYNAQRMMAKALELKRDRFGEGDTVALVCPDPSSK